MIRKTAVYVLRLFLVGGLMIPCLDGISAQETAVSSGSDYRIGPDDALRIQVWQRRDLSGEYVVDQQGELTLPLVGTLAVEGMTARELSTDLERRLVIMDPAISQVLVTVVGYHSQSFTVVGEIRTPGTYSFRELPNLWDIILMAGGETANADMSAVQIRREPRGGGPARILTVDLSGGLEGTADASLPALVPDDQIIVPGLLGGGGLANRIRVLGAVRNPGLYSLRIAPTVVSAVSASGGQVAGADMETVKLTRRTTDGTVVFDLDLKKYLEDGYPVADMQLQPGDTILIPSSEGLGATLGRALQVTGFLSAAAALIVAINTLN